MKDEEIDILFSNKLKDSENIPLTVKWNKDEGWKNLEKSLPEHRLQIPYWLKLATGVAACLVIVIGGYFLFKLNFSKTPFETEANLAIKEIVLPGGHRCTLAPYSKIQFIGSTGSKNCDTLYLDGEAYIVSSKKNPLVVKAKNCMVTCVRAEINVKAVITDNSVTVSAISGKVTALCTANNFPPLDVAPNEQFSVVENGILAFKTKTTDPNLLAWKTGTLTFDNVPLIYAVEVMEDYYGVCIKIEKEELKYCRITTHLSNVTFNEALRSIKNNLNIKVEKEGLMYLISGNGC
jgi:ferric-dicitrate binding protein FerR (iron transport regulator)